MAAKVQKPVFAREKATIERMLYPFEKLSDRDIAYAQLYRDAAILRGGKMFQLSDIVEVATPVGRNKWINQYATCSSKKALDSGAFERAIKYGLVKVGKSGYTLQQDSVYLAEFQEATGIDLSIKSANTDDAI